MKYGTFICALSFEDLADAAEDIRQSHCRKEQQNANPSQHPSRYHGTSSSNYARNGSSRTNKSNRSVKCFTCGGRGHYARECPSNKRNAPKGPFRGVSKRPSHGGGRNGHGAAHRRPSKRRIATLTL